MVEQWINLWVNSNSQRWKLGRFCMMLIVFCVKTFSFKIVSERLYINSIKLSEIYKKNIDAVEFGEGPWEGKKH